MLRKLAIVAALLLFGTAAHAACLADITSCPADPSWNGTVGYDDDFNGAGGSENACAARPEVWHQNCGPGTIVTEHYSQTFFYPPAGSDTTAPSQVSGLSTTVASSTEIDLSWTAATDNVGVTGYKVYRGGTLLTTLGNVTTFANTGLSPSTTYSYTVSALDAAGNEGTQSTASSKTTSAAPDTTAPTVPGGVSATAVSSTQINVAWTASTDNTAVTGYHVRRGGTVVATLGAVTTFNDTGRTPSTTYSYTVDAFDAAGNTSAQSTAASATTPAAPDTTAPSVPSGLSATAVSSTQINLAWTASTDNVAVTGYHVRRGGTVIATLGAVTTFQNTGLTASTTYSYTVDAFDAASNTSAQSTAASATTQAASASTETMGETTILTTGDSGNANFLLAQNATLPSAGSLQSISFYVTTAAGQLRLGVYTDASGVPGTLVAQTAAFTPVVGWNTVALTSSSLSAGTYWLAYAPSSNSLAFKVIGTGGLSKWKNIGSFAAMPSTFPTGLSGANGHWSFYATLNVTGGGGADTTAPSQVSGLSATAASSSQINLAWSAATDNVAVTGYKIYRGGSLVHTNGNTLTYSDTGLTASTLYSYQVSAIDAAGNEGTKSTAATATTQAATSVGPTGPVGPVATICTGTNIAAGANIQTAVNAAGTNTTFCLAAGTYTSQSVTPKAGDKFIGAVGAIMDGGGNTQRAFSGAVNNVTVQNLLIRNYTAGQQIAPISPGAGTGWQVLHNEITANPGAGVEIGVGMLVQFNFIHHNLEEGYACGNCDPTIATGIVIDSNEISFNNYTDAYDPGFEAGGGKLWQTVGAQVTHNYSHDNHGPGLWDDFQNDNIVYAFNRVENNTNGGIFHEIGYNASIHDNSISNNATSTNSASLCVWLWCPSIGVAASGGHNGGQVEIYNNTIVVSGTNGSGSTGVGIGLIQQARGNGTDGLPWLVQHVHVHDNTTTMTAAGSHQGAVEDNGDTAIFTSRDNTFVHNTYNLGTNNDAFWWNNADGGKTFWQGFGLDTTGTFN